jgi:MFS family permease
MSGDRGRRAVLSTLASLASLAAALSCCLPLGTLLFAAGSAGASLFAEKLRPWLLAFSAAALVLAFVQTYFRGRCAFRYRRVRTLLLWFSAVVVVGMLAAPQVFSALLAGRLPSFHAAGELRDFDERELAREFDAAIRQTRVVMLLSPT